MLRIVLILSLILGASQLGRAQQLSQFSQYMFNLYSINPAYAGVEDSWKVVFNNRYQWVGITDHPRTFNLSVYGPNKKKNMGFGGYVYTDVVGPTRRIGGQLSYSYHVKFSEKVRMSFSLSAGMIQYLLDGDKVNVMDPDDRFFSNGLLSQTRPDMKFGTWLYGENWYFGASLPQILQLSIYFYDIDKGGMAQLEDHYYFNGGYHWQIAPDWKLNFDALVKLAFPTPVKFDVNATAHFKNIVWLGAGYRYQDAVIFNVGFNIKNYLMFGYSYDYPITNIRSASSGTHEAYVAIQFGSNVIKSDTPKAED